jgi:membrane-associated phospholipid phosphatase
MKKLIKYFFPEDFLVIAFILILTILTLLFSSKPNITARIWQYYLPAIVALLTIIRITGKTRNTLFLTLRNWLPLFWCLFAYMNMRDLIPSINPVDIDVFLIKIDYVMFRVHPSVFLQKIVSPYLDDWMHFSYITYYLFPPLLAIILYWKKEYLAFRNLLLAFTLACFVGYLSYITFPAVGPRFSLASYYNVELKGKFITSFIRPTLDSLEPTKRDCFPSLHVAMVALVLWYAFKYKKKLFYVLLPFGFSLFFSTVYTRYHYVIDVLVGIVLSIICYYLAPILNQWWYKNVSKDYLKNAFPRVESFAGFFLNRFRPLSVKSSAAEKVEEKPSLK